MNPSSADPNPWAAFDEEVSWKPIPFDLPEDLPPNWSKSEEVTIERVANSHDVFHMIIPFSVFEGDATMDLSLEDEVDVSVYNAFQFVNKALCSKHEGTYSPNIHPHLFPDPNNPKNGIPKFRIFGELLVRRYRKLVEAYMRERYPNEAPTDVNVNNRSSEVECRRRVQTKDNVAGIRFHIHILDKRLNFGRALQHRLWKNEMLMGLKSPLKIYERYTKICDEWKKRIAQPKRTTMTSSAQEAAEYDAGPEVDCPDLAAAAAAAAEAEQEREEMGMLGDEKSEAEPDGENIGESGAMKAITAKKKKVKTAIPPAGAAAAIPDQGPVGGGDGDKEQQQENEREKERRRKEECERRLASLGMKIPESTRDAKAYTKQIKYIFNKYNNMNPTGQGQSGGQGRPRQQLSSAGVDKEAQRRELMRKVHPGEWHITQITTLESMVKHVYELLLRAPISQSDLNNLRNDCVDLGDYSHPLNPRKFFTFNGTLKNWFGAGSTHPDAIPPCREQCDEYNYYSDKPENKNEYQFPIPSLVWEIPYTDQADSTNVMFRSKELKRHKAFWWFSAFSEQLRETEAKARRRQQEELRALYQSPLALRRDRPNMSDFERSELEKDELWRASDAYRITLENSKRFGSKERFHTSMLSDRRALARVAAASGIQTSTSKIHNAQKDFVVDDILSEDIVAADKLYTRIKNAYEAVPEDQSLLIKLYRQHQFDVYKSRMKPGAAGVNEIHQLHTTYLNKPSSPEDITAANTVHFNYTGYENLTYFGSIVGEFLLGAKVHMGLSNSHHTLYLMSWNINANCYRASRRIALHVMKIGPPGLGKSYLDKFYKECNVPGTVIEALHASNLAKMVETVQNDRCIVEDEASSATIGDSARASNAKEHQSITMHKAWLSNDKISFMVWARREDGTTYQLRKIVAARGCHLVNANVHHVNKDRSVYDRYVSLP